MTAEYTIAWSVTRNSFRGASAAFVSSFENYIPTWADANRAGLISYELFLDTTPNSVIMSANVVTDKKVDVQQSRTESQEPQPQSQQLPEIEPSETEEDEPKYEWVFVKDLKVGDVVKISKRVKDTVAEISEESNRTLVKFEDAGPVLYGMKDKITRITT